MAAGRFRGGGVIGGGSSFLGAAIPLLHRYSNQTAFLAVESETAPALTQGEYRYGRQDVEGRLPLAQMYTLGTNHDSHNTFGGGVQLHARNPVLSALVQAGRIKPTTISREEAERARTALAQSEGIIAAPEPSYGLAGAINAALALNTEKSARERVVVFTLTGKSAQLNAG